MSFTNQRAFVVSEADLKRPWGGKRDGSRFRCYLCGLRFQSGDVARWVYTNGIPGAGGNPFTCSTCDGIDVVDKWAAMHNEAKERFWWFTQRDKE